MRIHGIRDKAFPFPVPQPNEKLKNRIIDKKQSRR